MGVDVIDVGVVPTPVLYYATFEWPLDGAVIITGSHNPPEDNGFKILRGRDSIYGADIRALLTAIESGAARAGVVPEARRGRVEERDVLERVPASTPARSCAWARAAPAWWSTPATAPAARPRSSSTAGSASRWCRSTATWTGASPTTTRIPTVEANLDDLRERVRETQAELGIALDGDADRLGAIDGQGRILWGDQLMILFGRDIAAEHPGARFIGEVKCSQALYDELARAGGEPIMWKVGHSLIKAKIKETGALLGGEMSGHLFFAHRYLGFDDAIYAGARLLELLSRGDASLAQLYDTLPVMVNTPEIRVPCDDGIKFDVVARITERLRGAPPGRERGGRRRRARQLRRRLGPGARLQHAAGAGHALRGGRPGAPGPDPHHHRRRHPGQQAGAGRVMNDLAIGIDIGGTNMRAALFRGLRAAAAAPGDAPAEAARPVVERRERVGHEREPEPVVERLASMVRGLLAEAGCDDLDVPVGVGFAGMMRGDRGFVVNSPNVGWREVPFGDLLRDKLGPRHTVAVENDANAIAWGEFHLGAGRGVKDIVVVYVGTGIGGGAVVNRTLVTGSGAARRDRPRQGGVGRQRAALRVRPQGLHRGLRRRRAAVAAGARRAGRRGALGRHRRWPAASRRSTRATWTRPPPRVTSTRSACGPRSGRCSAWCWPTRSPCSTRSA